MSIKTQSWSDLTVKIMDVFYSILIQWRMWGTDFPQTAFVLQQDVQEKSRSLLENGMETEHMGTI